MYDLDLKRVKKKLRSQFHNGKLEGREIFMFGISDNTRQIIQILRQYNLEPVSILDNDRSKQNSYCAGIKVISPDSVTAPSDAKKLYIIYSAYWREMQDQLCRMGVSESNILQLYKAKNLRQYLLWGCYGKIIYKSLVKKYGNFPMYICPYTGTGDIYLIGTFWEQYLNRNHIQDYIFVVLTNACKKTAMLFDIKNVELVREKWHVEALIYYYMLCPKETSIKILNDCWGQVHSNQSEWFRGYKGLYFTELFRKYVFGLPEDIKPEHPKFADKTDELNKIFKENALLEGKTVILSPYSNTLADLPMAFWEKVGDVLLKRGYVVCTNSSGPEEPAVKGTLPVFFPLNIAPQFVEKAGCFIGIRSGFCDIISGTKAKKIILYDGQNRFYNGSAFEYFSLKAMELCDDADEIIFDHGKSEDAVRQVIEVIDDWESAD